MTSLRKPRRGRLLLCGGSPDSCLHEFGNMSQNCSLPHLVILAHGEEKPREKTIELLEFFRAVCCGQVSYVLPEDYLVLPDGATSVYISGGSRARLLERLTEADRELLSDFLSAGGFIGLSGAAAALAGELSVRAGLEDGLLRSDSLALSDGLGLLGPVLVESKFEQRHKMVRLMAALCMTDINLAIGLDSDTGLIVGGPTHGLVVGTGHAWFLTRTRRHKHNIDRMIDVYPATASDINTSCLSGGQKFDFARNTWRPPF